MNTLDALLEHTKKTNPVYKDTLRAKRKPLLEAFDIYKSNVNYGLIEETESQKAQIKAWYLSALDLDTQALENVPSEVLKYVQINK